MLLIFTFSTVSDKDCFETVYQKYKNLMLKKAYSILKDYSLAEDAVSEASIRIYKNLHKIDDPHSNRTIAFVMMIVKNTSLTMLQDKNRHTADEIDETVQDSYNLEQSVLSKMSVETITGLLDLLDEESKSVFLYKYAYDLSHKEIGKILNLSENNVTVKLHRCKKRLASLIMKGGSLCEQ